MYENRTYAIVNTASFQAALPNLNLTTFIEKTLQTSLSNIRYSLDGSKFVIKCDNPTDLQYLRDRASEENITYTEHTHSQILPIMNSSEWQNENII